MIAGSRKSELAMRQAEMFNECLADAGLPACEIRGITATGDVDLVSPLKDMGGEGVFVRELDEALLRKEIDVSVNSLKDIPVKMDARLTIGAYLPRDDPRDALVPLDLNDIGCGAIIGTSSVRREMILRTVKPLSRVKPIRGNIRTRLEKLTTEEYSAILMAKAGIDRLNLDIPCHPLPKEMFVPAAGQGAIAVECRTDDAATIAKLAQIDDAKTRTEVTAERTVLGLMNAGCSSPIGINAEVTGQHVRLLGISFDYSARPIRLDTTFPLRELDTKLPAVADFLMSKRDAL